MKSRTLRAEIDLPNPESRLLPGMYAYARVIIERPGTIALPASAFIRSGEQTYCWLYRDGKAHQTEVRTGITDGDWYEIAELQTPETSAPKTGYAWKPPTGSEQVIIGDLSILTDGEPVGIASSKDEARPAAVGEAAVESRVQ